MTGTISAVTITASAAASAPRLILSVANSHTAPAASSANTSERSASARIIDARSSRIAASTSSGNCICESAPPENDSNAPPNSRNSNEMPPTVNTEYFSPFISLACSIRPHQMRCSTTAARNGTHHSTITRIIDTVRNLLYIGK